MTRERCRVLILGHGEMGRTMESLLAGAHALTVWEKDLACGTENQALETAAAGQEFLFFMLPAAAHLNVALRLQQHLPQGAIAVTVAKGVDEEGRPPALLLREVLGTGLPVAVLYGPMIAEELGAGRPGFAELGCEDGEAARRVEGLFAGSRLYLRRSRDLAGISWAAVLKNVYAPLLSAAQALGLGDNAHGFLASAALAEMDRMAVLLGGRPGTVYGLAGLADLVTTASSAGSSHRAAGRDLVRADRAPGQVQPAVEGVHTLRVLQRLPLLQAGDFPMFRLLLDLVDAPGDARGKFMRLFSMLLHKAP